MRLVLLASSLIASLSACTTDTGSAGTPTYSRDIAPIVEASCASCHRPGAIAPFAFTSYPDVADRAALVAHVTGAGVMPPFPPDTSGECRPLVTDGRLLTTSEIETFAAWEAAGAPEGEPGRLITPGDAATLEGALRIDMHDTYTPSTEIEDDYRCFMLDPGLEEDAYVTAYVARPGDPRIVHHVILFSIPDASVEAALLAADENTPGPGYTCFGDAGDPRAVPVGGWAPGSGVVRFPESTGALLPAGRRVVMQVHYHPIDEEISDRTGVSLELASSVESPGRYELFNEPDLVIPARSRGVTVEEEFVFTAAGLRVWGLFPHMHELGTRIRVEYTRAGSDEDECLISVPDWDFEWQGTYFLQSPVVVERGDTLRLTCVYDNDGDDPVYFGAGTDDEMCLVYAFVSD